MFISTIGSGIVEEKCLTKQTIVFLNSYKALLATQDEVIYFV